MDSAMCLETETPGLSDELDILGVEKGVLSVLLGL